MRKSLVLILVSLLSFTQCARRQPPHDDAGIKVIPLSDLPRRNARELSADMEIVPLETSGEVLVGSVRDITVSDRFIYLFDYNDNFFIFDRKGRFVSRSKPSGRGPKEFLHITRFFVDPKSDEIFVYDHNQQKLLAYDCTGNCINEICDINGLFSQTYELSFMNDGKVLANLIFSPGLNDYYAIMDPDRRFATEKLLLHHPYKWSRISHYAPKPKIATGKSGTRIVSIVSDTIYRISGGTAVPEYILDSGLPHAHADIPAETADFSDVMQYVDHDDKYTRGISGIIFTDNTGCSAFHYYRGRLNHIFWNLETGEGFMVPLFESDETLSDRMNLMTATSDSFVGIVYPYDIPEEELSRDNRLSGINPDDNPIVVFYRIDNLFGNAR